MTEMEPWEITIANLTAEVRRMNDSRKELALINDEKHRRICSLTNDVRLAVTENKRLREALEFYANKMNHRKDVEEGTSPVWRDDGETARAALEGK